MIGGEVVVELSSVVGIAEDYFIFMGLGRGGRWLICSYCFLMVRGRHPVENPKRKV
jgi:hypothetical protein